MGKHGKNLMLYGIVVIFAILLVYTMRNVRPAVVPPRFTFDMLIRELYGVLHGEGTNITEIELQRDAEFGGVADVTVRRVDGTSDTVSIGDFSHFMREYAEPAALANPNLTLIPRAPVRNVSVFAYLPTIILLIVSVFLLFFIIQQMQGGGGGGNRVMNFGKSRARVTIDEKKRVTFDKVRGLVEEKEDLQEIVEFLKAPDKFRDIGARIPKGVLLVGPPGTGKTLIARAVAGEAGVPFFSISGSDFVEMFVGVGASRVRDLFDQAKKNSPCIVFIDEIDAVGRRRGAGLGGGHDEREQTLNQLLVEMDGFGVNEGIIILAATNRPDILDPAILRPGRFDRRVVVGRPDVRGREEILRLYAETKKMATDVDFRALAQTTAGFTGADLENLLNEAALLAARDNLPQITAEYVRKAFVKVGIGTEKKSRVITEKERRITAYHEAGHAIMFEMLPDTDPVHLISIISTGAAGGYVMPLPLEERLSVTKGKMEQDIACLLGGRAAEKLVLDDVTTGASNDIERATGIARNMVTRFGMSDELGPIQFGGESEEVFIGRDWGHTRNYSENVAQIIDREIKRIVEFGYDKAMRIIKDHMGIMHKTVELLLAKEKITGAEFRSLFPEGILPAKDRTDAMARAIVAPDEIIHTPEPPAGEPPAPNPSPNPGKNPDKDIY